jgi:hypothetical protein
MKSAREIFNVDEEKILLDTLSIFLQYWLILAHEFGHFLNLKLPHGGFSLGLSSLAHCSTNFRSA